MKNWVEDWIVLFSSDRSGSIRVAVTGMSMAPMLQPGDEAIVEPVSPNALNDGDLVVVRAHSGGLLHRYLGRWRGRIMTKGDGRRHLDPLWDADRVLGRVVEVWRDSECIYRWRQRAAGVEWLRARWHLAFGGLWSVLRALKGWIVALSLLLLFVLPVAAAVTLTGFDVEPGEQEIFVYWETASETGNLGFYVWRSEEVDAGYEKLPLDDPEEQFIPSEDEGVGAFYEYMDTEVTPDVVYYYKVQDIPDNGSPGEYSEVKAASIAGESPEETPSDTPTATPTATPTSTPTFTPQPTNTSEGQPQILFWASETTLDAGDCTTIQWQVGNVESVYFDGEGVAGQGARTFCPCEDETHVLTVYFQDGGAEEREITLDMLGSCSYQDSPVATPSIEPSPTPSTTPEDPADTSASTPSPSPEPLPQLTVSTATPIPTQVRSEVESPRSTASPTTDLTSEATPLDQAVSSTPTPIATQVIVEGGATRSENNGNRTLVLGVGTLFGLVLIGGGFFLWKRWR